jgi:hypothetical protein
MSDGKSDVGGVLYITAVDYIYFFLIGLRYERSDMTWLVWRKKD